MKKISFYMQSVLLLFILFSGGISCSHAQSFEGVIHYTSADAPGGQKVDLKYMIKDSKIRWEFGQGDEGGAMLYFPETSKMVFIINKMHSYMEMDDDAMAKMGDESSESKWADSKMVKTGQHKTIAGHRCEVWKITNEQSDKINLCMAKGLGSFVTPGNPMAKKNAPAWAKKIMGDGYMPLEVVQNDGGNETTQLKATSIEKKSLDASLFKIPDGYKDMSSMMKQMMKMKSGH